MEWDPCEYIERCFVLSRNDLTLQCYHCIYCIWSLVTNLLICTVYWFFFNQLNNLCKQDSAPRRTHDSDEYDDAFKIHTHRQFSQLRFKLTHSVFSHAATIDLLTLTENPFQSKQTYSAIQFIRMNSQAVVIVLIINNIFVWFSLSIRFDWSVLLGARDQTQRNIRQSSSGLQVFFRIVKSA